MFILAVVLFSRYLSNFRTYINLSKSSLDQVELSLSQAWTKMIVKVGVECDDVTPDGREVKIIFCDSLEWSGMEYKWCSHVTLGEDACDQWPRKLSDASEGKETWGEEYQGWNFHSSSTFSWFAFCSRPVQWWARMRWLTQWRWSTSQRLSVSRNSRELHRRIMEIWIEE